MQGEKKKSMVIAGHFQVLRCTVINRYGGHRQAFLSLLMYVTPSFYSVTTVQSLWNFVCCLKASLCMLYNMLSGNKLQIRPGSRQETADEASAWVCLNQRCLPQSRWTNQGAAAYMARWLITCCRCNGHQMRIDHSSRRYSRTRQQTTKKLKTQGLSLKG